MKLGDNFKALVVLIVAVTTVASASCTPKEPVYADNTKTLTVRCTKIQTYTEVVPVSSLIKGLRFYKTVQKQRTQYYTKYFRTCIDGYVVNSTGYCKACQSGYYGKDCLNKCQCGPGTQNCNNENGYCACKIGWYGNLCDKSCWKMWSDVCANVTSCFNSTTTLRINETGHDCVCKPGYTGSLCDKPCSVWTYGKECGKYCSCIKGNTKSCNHITGQCSCKFGWYGTDCEKKCEEGIQITSCNRSLCNCVFHQGDCPYGNSTCLCFAGFHGKTCEFVCPNGFYGSGCRQMCACENNSTCSAMHGRCLCTEGWKGVKCNEKCNPGWFGINCSNVCQCYHSRGKCDHINGKCICNFGYTGVYCTKELSSQNLVKIVASSAGAFVLLLAFLIVVVMYVRRTQNKSRKNEVNNQYEFSTTSKNDEMDNDYSQLEEKFTEEKYNELWRENTEDEDYCTVYTQNFPNKLVLSDKDYQNGDQNNSFEAEEYENVSNWNEMRDSNGQYINKGVLNEKIEEYTSIDKTGLENSIYCDLKIEDDEYEDNFCTSVRSK